MIRGIFRLWQGKSRMVPVAFRYAGTHPTNPGEPVTLAEGPYKLVVRRRDDIGGDLISLTTENGGIFMHPDVEGCIVFFFTPGQTAVLPKGTYDGFVTLRPDDDAAPFMELTLPVREAP